MKILVYGAGTIGCWEYSTPEEHGMNSATLVAMMDSCNELLAEDPELYIDSMTVIRNGCIIADFYNNPLYPRDEMHVAHSVTKSNVSALIGIALEQGHIDGVESRIVSFFPDRTIANLGDRKRELTIGDLLSVESGLHSRDSYLYKHEGLFASQVTSPTPTTARRKKTT